jgi:hypothetical protein
MNTVILIEPTVWYTTIREKVCWGGNEDNIGRQPKRYYIIDFGCRLTFSAVVPWENAQHNYFDSGMIVQYIVNSVCNGIGNGKAFSVAT